MKRSTVHWLASLAVGLTVLLMTLGAYSRGSGFDGAVLWMAVLVGLVAIIIVYAAVRLGLDRRWVVLPAAGAVVAIGIQAWLGWLHSNSDSGQEFVLAHLFVSLMIIGLLVVVAVSTRAAPDGPNLLERDWSRQLAIGSLGVFIVLMLGSMIHDIDVSGWLKVNGEWAPDFSESSELSLYWGHRMASAAVFVFLLFLVWRGAHVERPRTEGYLVIGATALFVANILLGILQVTVEAQSDWAGAFHLGLGTATWAALLGATFLSFHDPR